MNARERFLEFCAAGDGPGAILDIQAPSHGIRYSGAAGLFRRGTPEPLTPEHAFRIASMSKTVTSAVTLRLAEQGVLALDDPLVDRLPGVAGRVHPDITLRQLLSHTAGLWDFAMSTEWQREIMRDRSRFFDPGWILDWALGHGEPVGKPGEQYHYSDTGYVLLGHVLERATGSTVAQLSRELVIDPLGMHDTWLEGHETPRGPALSHTYFGDQDGLQIHGSVDWAAGGHVSTVRDLERLLRGMFEGKLYERPETLQAMRTTGPTPEGGFYGLGLGQRTVSGNQIVGHSGFWGSFMYLMPEHGATIIGTVNRAGFDRVDLFEAVVGELSRRCST